MLDKKISTALNEQITKELYSAYLYHDIANYYDIKGLKGFASWFRKQSQEEIEHATKINNYLLDEGVKPEPQQIKAPNIEFDNNRKPLEEAYEHEKYITSSINAIYKLAKETDDYRTTNFLAWFINEQAEEEKNAATLISEYDLFAGDAHGLYLLNTELGQRK